MMRVDSVKDKNILKKLGEANFGRLQIGVESFVPEKIRYFNKKNQKGKGKGIRQKGRRADLRLPRRRYRTRGLHHHLAAEAEKRHFRDIKRASKNKQDNQKILEI